MGKYTDVGQCPQCGAKALPDDKQPVSGTHMFTMIYECKSRWDYVHGNHDAAHCANKCGQKYVSLKEQLNDVVNRKIKKRQKIQDNFDNFIHDGLEYLDISDEHVQSNPRKVHDFRNYLDDEVIQMWPYLQDETKQAYALMAEKFASREEWE